MCYIELLPVLYVGDGERQFYEVKLVILPRPSPWKGDTLPTELPPRINVDYTKPLTGN